MEKNTQLPVEVETQITKEAEAHNTRLKEHAESEKDEAYAQGFAEGWGEGATAYATKLHKVEQENAELRRQNDKLREQAEASGPRWVPASKYEFKQIGHYPYRFREAPGEDYDYGEIYVTEDDGAIFFDVDHECEYIPQNDGRWLKYDILDESPATFNPELLQVISDAEQSNEDDLKADNEAIGGAETGMGDAVAFLTWVRENEYTYNNRNGGYWYEYNDKLEETYLCDTDTLLYELFKQQKEGK